MGDFGVRISSAMINLSENFFADELFIQNFSEHGFDALLGDTKVKTIVIAFYVIVILTGFFGNSILFGTILRNKHLHKTTNIFIASLALSDVIICTIDLPLQLQYQLTGTWAYGEWSCRLLSSLFGVPIFLSAFSTAMVAVDRYLLIVHPHRKRMTKKTAKLIVIALIILSIGLSSPVSVNTQYHVVIIPPLKVNKSYCIEVWSKISAIIYGILLFCVQFILPTVTMLVLYSNVSNALLKKDLQRNNSSRGRTRRRRRNQRTNRMIVIVVFCFVIQWLPWNIYSLIIHFNHKIIDLKYLKLTDVLLKLLALTSACINPVLNGLMNKNFRKAFLRMISRRKSEKTGTSVRSLSSRTETIRSRLRSFLSDKHALDNTEDKTNKFQFDVTTGERRSGRLHRQHSEGHYELEDIARFSNRSSQIESSKLANVSEGDTVRVRLSVAVETPSIIPTDTENMTHQSKSNAAVILSNDADDVDNDSDNCFVQDTVNKTITFPLPQKRMSLRKSVSLSDVTVPKVKKQEDYRVRSMTNEYVPKKHVGADKLLEGWEQFQN